MGHTYTYLHMDIWWMTWEHIHVNIKSHMKDYNVAMCKIVANEILYITPLSPYKQSNSAK